MLFRSALLGKPCIVKAAASGPYGDIARLQKAWMGQWMIGRLRRADALVSLNADLTSELVAAGVPHDRIRAIPNGVDCARFVPPSLEQRQAARSAFNIPPDTYVVLFAGRLVEEKGVTFLIDAWRVLEAQSPNLRYHLLVAGNGRRGAEYRERATTELRQEIGRAHV